MGIPAKVSEHLTSTGWTGVIANLLLYQGKARRTVAYRGGAGDRRDW